MKPARRLDATAVPFWYPGRMKGTLNGVLNLNKPGGLTSRAVVDMVVRPLRRTKVGHAGTLDPLATGVLVVCVGTATRLIEYVQRMPKTYRTTVRLGARSDTLDADGTVVAEESPRVPGEPEIRTALAAQVGTIAQIPPQYSALKVQGQRAYDMARAGHSVDLAPRQVLISRIDVLAYAWPRLDLEIDCGSGTYIRSIARDLGEALGCGGLVEVLTRTRIGPFTLDDCARPARIDGRVDPGPVAPDARSRGQPPAALPLARSGRGDRTGPGLDRGPVRRRRPGRRDRPRRPRRGAGRHRRGDRRVGSHRTPKSPRVGLSEQQTSAKTERPPRIRDSSHPGRPPEPVPVPWPMTPRRKLDGRRVGVLI